MHYLISQTPTPTMPTSGDFWNPSNWTEFVKVIGIPSFFALIFFSALAYLWWKQQRQPSNLEQVRLLKLIYATLTADAFARNKRIRTTLRQFCCIAQMFADNAKLDIRSFTHDIQTALDDNGGPPPIPTELMIDDEPKK